MKVIFEEHISIRKQPKNIESEDILLFKHELEKRIGKTYVIKVLNCFILQDMIINFFESPKKYLSFTSVHPNISLNTLFWRFLQFRHRWSTIASGVWIIDNWSNGYFHWLTDALPRLLASQRSGQIQPVILPAYYSQFSFVEESLQLLGTRPIFFDIQKPLRVKELVLPSHTASTGNYNQELIKELRNRLVFSGTPTRKVFVSRLKASKRKITNEAEVVALLESYSYEIHYFEDYSFSKQIEIMSQTKHLIGLHGAGLTNMLFMKEGGKILELRNRNDAQNNCYFSLASELNLEYFYQLNLGQNDDTHVVDVHVDIEKLKHNIALMD